MVELSVLMIAHNAESTILSSVRSALFAMPKNAELIVFLDGCSDATSQKLSTVSDSRLRVLESKTKVGIVSARNSTISNAKGDLLATLDSDDICLPWRFRSGIRNLRKKRLDFLFTTAIILKKSLPTSLIIPQFPLAISPELAGAHLSIGNPFVHSSLICRREAIDDLGGYRDRSAEDYDLWVLAALAGKRIQQISTYSVIYRIHVKQTTKKVNWQERHKIELASGIELMQLQGKVASELQLESFLEAEVQRELSQLTVANFVYFQLLGVLRKCANRHLSR